MYGKKLKVEKIVEIRNKIEMKWEAVPYEKNVLCALSVWIIYAFNWITMFHIQ